MPYLIIQDYYSTIQSVNLSNILTDEDSLRLIKQETALQEVKSYLTQKYDCADEFRETVVFSFTATYKAKQLVYLDASAYSATATYALNALTLYLGNVYKNKTAITVGEAFTANKWDLLGAQYALFYVSFPKDEFNLYSFYKKGNQVWYKDKTYTALRDTILPSHQGNLQAGEEKNLVPANSFPDSEGNTQWGSGTSYSVTGYWPTDTTKWASGDNRNAQIVEALIHLTIYKLSARISPRNVPDVWVKNYDDAITLLKRAAKGEVTLDIPLIQPSKPRVRWGSEIKQQNYY